MATQLEDILKLSVSERILWAEALWNSIAAGENPEKQMDVSAAHKKILDEELAAYKRSPAEGSSWKVVKAIRQQS
jgi:putative addiction module component (TIGR02574 family)